MRRKIRAIFLTVALAVTFAVIAVAMPQLLAAERFQLNASTSISFKTIANQQTELNNMGLKLELKDGKPTLTETSNSLESLSNSGMKERHADMIGKGILRYALYNGSLCQQSQNNELQLIIILDFSSYDVTVFEGGFLKGLTYVILGSGEFFGMGSKFEENNGEGGALTVYDSSNGGAVITDPYKLTLGGFGSDTSTYIQVNDGDMQYVSRYSIRIILPGHLGEPVTLKTDSLTLKGVNSFGGMFSPKQPDCIGIGISHLGITKEHEKTIVIENGAADSSHLHWLTVTGGQMEYALINSLDKMLSTDATKKVETGHVDEIFRKPHEYSDFSYLYLQAYKESETNVQLNLYDPPAGEVTEDSTNGMAAAVRLFYWFEYVYKKLPTTNLDGSVTMTFNHYRRSSANEIEAAPGIMSYESEAGKTIGGEQCHAVKCSHFADNGSVIGYFSASGKVYDAQGNPSVLD